MRLVEIGGPLVIVTLCVPHPCSANPLPQGPDYWLSAVKDGGGQQEPPLRKSYPCGMVYSPDEEQDLEVFVENSQDA